MFGVVLALIGARLSRLVDGAKGVARECGPTRPVEENPGSWLGAIMGELPRDHGRDKLTLLALMPDAGSSASTSAATRRTE